jgi:hypothetical protein
MNSIHNMQQARQRQEDPLNLRSLPLVTPPDDGWPQIEAGLLQHGRRRSAMRYAGAALAVAAMVTLAVGLTLRQPEPLSGAAVESIPPQLAQNDPAILPAPAADATLDSLIALSQQLEGQLRVYRSEVGGLPSEALIYQVELEDLVAQVDGELSMNPDSITLWSQRVNLMLDLSQLYETSMRRNYRQVASL